MLHINHRIRPNLLRNVQCSSHRIVACRSCRPSARTETLARSYNVCGLSQPRYCGPRLPREASAISTHLAIPTHLVVPTHLAVLPITTCAPPAPNSIRHVHHTACSHVHHTAHSHVHHTAYSLTRSCYPKSDSSSSGCCADIFGVYDQDNDGYLSRDELYAVLKTVSLIGVLCAQRTDSSISAGRSFNERG